MKLLLMLSIIFGVLGVVNMFLGFENNNNYSFAYGLVLLLLGGINFALYAFKKEEKKDE